MSIVTRSARPRRSDLLGLTFALALAPACAGEGGTSASATGTGGASTGEPGTDSVTSTGAVTTGGESSGSTSTTGAGTGTGGSTTTAATTTTGGETGTTGAPACPPPDVVSAEFALDPEPAGLDAETCLVTAITSQPTSALVALACDGGAYVLTLASEPFYPPTLAVDDVVLVDYVRDEIFWVNRWLAVRTASGERTLVGAVASSALDPPGLTLVEFFGNPAITEFEGICEPTRELCGPEERLALSMAVEGFPYPVLDHSVGFVDILAYGIHMVVEVARRSIGSTCDDYPEAWFDFLFVWFPSD